jgi:hypothetical protein
MEVTVPSNPSTDDEMTALMIERGIAYVFRPQISQLTGGSFEARYPAADWTATGASRDDAIANLGDAALNRRGTADETSWQVAAVREHLAHGPLDGVYEIPLDVNDRIMASKDPQAALTDVLDAIDAQRAQ